MSNKPNKIILHHSLTKDSETVSWGPIRNYHIRVNKTSDIGYHFGIEDARGEIEIFMGLMVDHVGAHCRDYNTNSIGICFIGNFDNEVVPQKVWDKGIQLVKFLRSQYGINTVLGHTELNSNKSCPGKKFDLDKFRSEVGL